MNVKYIQKYFGLFLLIIFAREIIHSLSKNNHNKNDMSNKYIKFNDYSFHSYIEKISNVSDLYITINNISYQYSIEYDLIEFKYFFKVNKKENHSIRPSDLLRIYNLHFLCNIYIFENEENVYSLANIFQNQFFFCVEYIKLNEQIKFGITIYKTEEMEENIEFYEYYFFTNKIINDNLCSVFLNNSLFNIYYLRKKYIELLFKIKKLEKNNNSNYETYKLKLSFLKPPLNYLKREIATKKGNWYFNNIYGSYFCFCRDKSCLNVKLFKTNLINHCKYYFYLTIINNNRHLYPKTHYLLGDFLNKNIECADALPIFKEMIKQNLNAHYLTMSIEVYNDFCSNNSNCYKDSSMIYGVRLIDGEFLEKYLELLLKLKVVITGANFFTIDNIFYNIDYITYIFLGHGVQYIKSFLYNNYCSYKKYNKILLPPYEKIIDTALKAGWKIENIIKMNLPKWDNFEIYNSTISLFQNKTKKERSIFLMFTWREIKKNKRMSELYYDNINKILNNNTINELLEKNNIKFYYCYHHSLRNKRRIKTNNNARLLKQNEISSLLKNSSLVITDFSSILFDTIVQKKPLILYIPDALDENLQDLYENYYYETIEKLKNGTIYLYELFLDLEDVINKIIYYINNDFSLEHGKLMFYNQFKFSNKGNTKNFINYLKLLN